MSFAALSARAQVARLRRTALDALRQYPLQVARLKLLNHGYNTTFRVDAADGRRFALRLNVNSRRSLAQIRAEMAWLDALARDTDLNLPTPQPAADGRLMIEVPSIDMSRDLPAALFSWLPGPDVGEARTTERLAAVGRAAAALHAHARGWALPEGASLLDLRSPLMDSPSRLDGDSEHLTPERRAVIAAAFSQVDAVLSALYARETPRALHADLHPGNLKWCRGRLYVFDFDDCALGLPAQDLAIASYHVRDNPALEEAFLKGYQSAAPLPAISPAEREALVAGRALTLLNDLLGISNARYRAILPRYASNCTLKLRSWLDTGAFRHDVPGVVPLA